MNHPAEEVHLFSATGPVKVSLPVLINQTDGKIAPGFKNLLYNCMARTRLNTSVQRFLGSSRPEVSEVTADSAGDSRAERSPPVYCVPASREPPGPPPPPRGEHGALFKPLVTAVLDYSHLHSLTLPHTRKHFSFETGRATNAAEADPCQQETPLACGDKQKQSWTFLIPPVTDTELIIKHIHY